MSYEKNHKAVTPHQSHLLHILILLFFFVPYECSCFAQATAQPPAAATQPSQARPETKRDAFPPQTWRQRYPRKPNLHLMLKGIEKAKFALSKSPRDAESVWSLDTLSAEFAPLPKLLDDYLSGSYAQSVRTIDLENMTKEEIHARLIQAGFTFSDEPAEAQRNRGGRRYGSNVVEFRKKDNREQVLQRIYVHPDGGMVRLKFHGALSPDRPEPHVVKAVRFDPKAGHGWENEAFKVSNAGVPIPKAPTPRYGLKAQPKESSGPDEDYGWMEWIMSEAHPDIKDPRTREMPILGTRAARQGGR